MSIKPYKQPLTLEETAALNELIALVSIGSPTDTSRLNARQLEAAKNLKKRGYVSLFGDQLIVLMAP